MGESPGVRPPLQARSHRTFAALLDATEELLDDHLFSDISVQEIVDRADSSAGSFYTRFESKKALLGALQDRLHDTLRTGVQHIPDDWVEGEVSDRSLAEAFVDKTTADHAANEGLIRALMTESQTDSTIIERSLAMHRDGAEFTAPYLDAPGRSEQEKADRLTTASVVLLAVLNQRMLYSHGNAKDPGSGDAADANDSHGREGLISVFLAALGL